MLRDRAEEATGCIRRARPAAWRLHRDNGNVELSPLVLGKKCDAKPEPLGLMRLAPPMDTADRTPAVLKA